MTLSKKTFRFYYWLLIEFFKKQARVLALSFFLSFFVIVAIISFSPYIQTLFLSQKDIIGIVGDYNLHNLPEEVGSKISNGLLYINEKGEYIPTLASTWEIASDAKEFRFHLREGLLWSNGKKFSAFDIPYQFKNTKIEVIDDKTVYFKLKESLPIFPTLLTKPIIIHPLVGVAGLYKVDRVKSQSGRILELSLGPNKKDLPLIIYKFYKSESDLINAYKRGQINQMTISKKSVAYMFRKWKNTTISNSVDYSKLMTLFFNFKNNLLADKEFRQALIMAVDRNEFKNYGKIALGSITPVSWAYNTNLKTSVFDQSTAEKILKKYLTSTQSANLDLFTYYDYLGSAEQIASQFSEAGIKTNLKLLSSGKPEDFDLFLAYLNIPSDPDQYFFWHSAQTQGNLGSYKNLKIDKLLEDARKTGSIRERKVLYEEFQKIIEDDPPAIFLFFPYVYTVKRK